MKYLKYFKTSNQFDDFKLDDTNTPNVSLIEELYSVKYTDFIPRDYSKDYFTIIALENSIINIDLIENSENGGYYGGLSYSLDNGETWSEEYGEIDNLNISSGQKVLFKGNMQTYIEEWDQVADIERYINSTGNYEVAGNIMSLFYGDNFKDKDTMDVLHILTNFFKGDTHLINAQNLILPATNLIDKSYYYTFADCVNLVTAPKILPATTLEYAENCYEGMFSGCTSLTKAPELPAITLGYNCYADMFYNCSSLVIAPELPATVLGENCYYEMFYGCTSLIKAPDLLAPTLLYECYQYMFYGCTSLNYIKCLAINNLDQYWTGDWLNNVSATGTFVQDINATWEFDSYGIPEGWEVVKLGDPEPSGGEEDSSSAE